MLFAAIHLLVGSCRVLVKVAARATGASTAPPRALRPARIEYVHIPDRTRRRDGEPSGARHTALGGARRHFPPGVTSLGPQATRRTAA